MNHWPEYIKFGREHPWGEDIQVYSNKVPRVMYVPAQGLKVLHSDI